MNSSDKSDWSNLNVGIAAVVEVCLASSFAPVGFVELIPTLPEGSIVSLSTTPVVLSGAVKNLKTPARPAL